jgi:hypothetical protein
MSGTPASTGELRLRGFLFSVLMLGMTGTAVELVLLEHTETLSQLVPLAVLAAGILSALVAAIGRTAGTFRLLRAVMSVLVVSGAAGLYLHYKGNTEFELEMYPTMAGFELFKESMMGATPALAPGTMAWLGFLGLAFAYRHPWMRDNGPT